MFNICILADVLQMLQLIGTFGFNEISLYIIFGLDWQPVRWSQQEDVVVQLASEKEEIGNLSINGKYSKIADEDTMNGEYQNRNKTTYDLIVNRTLMRLYLGSWEIGQQKITKTAQNHSSILNNEYSDEDKPFSLHPSKIYEQHVMCPSRNICTTNKGIFLNENYENLVNFIF